MATVHDFIHTLRQQYPGFWESLTDQQKDRIRSIDKNTYGGFFNTVETFKSFTTWQAAQPPAEGGEQQPEPETPADAEETTTPPAAEEDPIDTDVRDLLAGFLQENQLPSTLMGFITDSLAQKKSYAQIVAELRQTPEYKAAYPENEIRQANGLSWMSEAQIRSYRDEARRLAQEYLGVNNVTQDELNNVIGKGWSLATFEKKLQRYREFERWGPAVKGVLEQELGHSIDDERLFAFFDDTSTPELDTAYERALLRGQPAVLGLGIRPEQEAELLRRYGIAPEQAFAGYQKLAQELPAAQRFNLIEQHIGRNQESFPTGGELFANTPFATLFRAIQLGDQSAIATLQGQMAREVARFQGQGGTAQNQSGASVGLLEEEDRRV